MKKFLLIFSGVLLCTGICVAATYKIKTSGNSTVIRSSGTTTTKNIYNNYSAGQYVSSNTVNSSYAGVIELVMDYSGSMSDVVEVAQNTMANVVAQIPSSTKVGFRVFGQGDAAVNSVKMGEVKNVKKSSNKNGETVYKLVTGEHQNNFISNGTGCDATQQVTPIIQANSTALINGMHSVSIGGSTPMVLALQKAVYTDMASLDTRTPKKIVLITDGGENCGGDPCAFGKTLAATRRDIQVDVVLVSSNSKELYCLASVTGGKVYNLNNVNQFQNVMVQSMTSPTKNSPQNTNTNQNNNNQQNYEFLNE